MSLVNRYFNYSVIALAFTMPISRSGISLFFALPIVLWIIEGGFAEKWQILKTSRTVIYLFTYSAVALFSLLYTENFPKALDNGRNFGYFLLIPPLLTSFRGRYLSRVFLAFTVGMVIHIILSWLFYFEVLQNSDFLHVSTGLYKDPAVFMNHIEYGTYLAFFNLLLPLFIFNKRSGWKGKAVLLVIFGASIGIFFVVFARMGQIAYFITVPLLFFIFLKGKKKLYASLAVLLLFFGAYFGSSAFRERTVHGIINNIGPVLNKHYDHSFGIRAIYLIGSFDLFLKNPIFGVGLGDNMDELNKLFTTEGYREVVPTSHLFKVIQRTHFHNQFMQVAVQTGLTGLIPFIMIFISFGISVYRSERFRVVAIGLLSLIMIGCLMETFFMRQFLSVLPAFWMGVFLAVVLREGSEGDQGEQNAELGLIDRLFYIERYGD